MLEKNMTLTCNGRTLATNVFIPEGTREEHKGAYGFEFTEGVAMMWMFAKEGLKMFDMMWMKHKIGYIAIDSDMVVTDVGVLKPWISLRFPWCMYWVELPPEQVVGIKEGDTVSWVVNT